MDFSAFSHGQIQSKLWLAENLEKFIPFPLRTAIVGSWYNVLGFMLLSRNHSLYEYIHGYDIDHNSSIMADKINDAWMINENQKIKNFTKNANCIDFSCYDLIISTSVEDISSIWYDKILSNTLVCLQAIDLLPEVSDKYPNWKIKNYIPDMETFKEKYDMKEIFFEGITTYDYTHLKYNRFMLIGKK